MLEQVQAKQLFTTFPDAATESEGPSKSQLKKLAKAQALKDKKAGKPAGGDQAPADGEKKQKQKQQQKKP